MKTNFNFKSQICTDKNQSERLLALGLKPETADMYYSCDIICAKPYHEVVEFMNGCVPEDIFPAWSLHRLIELIWGEGEHIMSLETHRPFEDCIERIDYMINHSCCFNKEYLVNQAEIEEHCKGVLEYLDYIRGEEE